MSRVDRSPLRARLRPSFCLALAATGMFASAPSSAQTYAMRDVGGWTVAASQDRRGCFLTRTYQGPGGTTLLFGLDLDGSNRLSVLNSNWSINEADRESLTFRLSNGSFPKHPAVGIASNGKRGFVSTFGKKFPAGFAAATFLHIFRGNVPVEQLSLDGSGAAVAELRECVDLFRAQSGTEAQRGKRANHIPIDPFASETTDQPKK